MLVPSLFWQWAKPALWVSPGLVVFQLLNRVWLFKTPWAAACQVSLSFTISQSLLNFISTESVMPSKHLILCCPFLLLSSVFPSIRVFSNESALGIRWPKYWSFSVSPSNEYSGLIPFRTDWFDQLMVQGTLRSLLQHRNSKALILRCSAFFIIWLSYPYMTTGKTIAFFFFLYFSYLFILINLFFYY